MKILSVDLGQVRTGVAISDSQNILASPLCVIKETDKENLADKIRQICLENSVSKIILGLPKNMDGSEGLSAQNARTFGDLLSQKTHLPVIMLDERRTTVAAHNYLNITNVRGKKRKNVIDAVSAVIILQDYLDSNKYPSE